MAKKEAILGPIDTSEWVRVDPEDVDLSEGDAGMEDAYLEHMSEWVSSPATDLSEDGTGRGSVDLSGEQEEEAGAYSETSADYDGITVWSTKPSGEVLETERAKEALLKDHHDYHFEGEDPSDGMTDDELWEAMPKPWRGDE